MKPRHSHSLLFVWRIAEAEASNLNCLMIDPNHLLIALCKAVDLDLPAFVEEDLPDRDALLEELLREMRYLREAFHAAGLDTKRFRRALRAKNRKASRAHVKGDDRTLTRSPEARKVFLLAEQISTLEGNIVWPSHLLQAIASVNDQQRDELLAKFSLSSNGLQRVFEKKIWFDQGSRSRAAEEHSLN